MKLLRKRMKTNGLRSGAVGEGTFEENIGK